MFGDDVDKYVSRPFDCLSTDASVTNVPGLRRSQRARRCPYSVLTFKFHLISNEASLLVAVFTCCCHRSTYVVLLGLAFRGVFCQKVLHEWRLGANLDQVCFEDGHTQVCGKQNQNKSSQRLLRVGGGGGYCVRSLRVYLFDRFERDDDSISYSNYYRPRYQGQNRCLKVLFQKY